MRRYLTALALVVVATTAHAASPSGEWLVQDRTARVLIRKCGPNLCGKLSWSSDGKEVGRSILIDMKPDGGRWTGTVVDVRDGTSYLAHVSLQSDSVLKVDGCVMGGAICGGETWTRYR